VDILLTHGYFLVEDEAEKRVMKPYPPLGILYISSYLKKVGLSVEIFDSTFHTKPDFVDYINEKRPRIVGIYVNLMTKLSALELIKHCKGVGSLVVVGGPEIPFYGEQFLSHGADVGVIGEGELTLHELIPHLKEHGPVGMHHIKGIVYRETDGSVVRTPERDLIPDLDTMPVPDRGAIELERYIDTWKLHHGKGSVSLICARGCPYTCTWCSRSVFGDTHRRRSPHHVADEIEQIVERYNPDMLWFADDVFSINHRWLVSFHEEMKRRSLRVPFECISRADRLNKNVLEIMADMGCFRVWFGSESGSQRILDAMQRRVKVQQIRDVTRLAREVGIEAGLFVMLGYPGEEIADIDQTIQHLVDTDPDLYLTTVAYPIKGTTFYNEVKDRLIVPGEWKTITDRTLDFEGRRSQQFYWFATRHLNNEVAYQRSARGIRNHGNRSKASLFAKSRIARLGMLVTDMIQRGSP
jgi:radical SAM superfamily enzyme YgiQ (UPF0313 family)